MSLFHEKGGHHPSHYRVGLTAVTFPFWFILEGGECSISVILLILLSVMLLLLGFLLVPLLSVILLVTVVLIGLERVAHISNLDFLLLRDPTVLPYPLSYSELESLESLYSWQSFLFCDFSGSF